MRITLLLGFTLLSATMLSADGWPGITVPSLEQFQAEGASQFYGSPPPRSYRDKDEQAYALGGQVITYTATGEFRSLRFTFDSLDTEDRVGDTLPVAARKALFTAGKLPRLPDFVTEWGVSWESTARQWLEAVENEGEFAGPFGSYNASLHQDFTAAPEYQGGVSRHPGGHGQFSMISSADPRYRVSVWLDSVDAAGPDVPFSLHSLVLEYRPEIPRPGRHFLFPSSANPTLDDEHRSALALSALLMEQNGQGHETLDPVVDERIRDDPQTFLSRDWGIQSREDLLAMLQHLDAGAHGKSFQDLANLLDAHPGIEAWKLAETLHLSASKASQLLLVATMRTDLGPQGISAWDEGRRVALARWGYHVGYLSEDEAWSFVMATWHKLAGQYRSWNDYYYHYIVGRAFWAAAFEDDIDKLNDGLEQWSTLTWRRDGVWNQPWPGSDQRTSPDHNPWILNYDPTAEAHSLYDLVEASNGRLTTDYGLETAKDHLKWAAIRTPHFALVTHEMIAIDLRIGQNDEALSLAQTAVEDRPELALVWNDLGDARAAADPKGAEDAYAKAIEIDPNYFEALDGMGRQRLQRSDWKAALTWFERARAASPALTAEDDGNFFFRLAFTYNRNGQYKNALPLVENLLRLYPVAAVQYEAGICYYSLGEPWWPQARTAFQDAKAKGHALPPGIERWLAQSN